MKDDDDDNDDKSEDGFEDDGEDDGEDGIEDDVMTVMTWVRMTVRMAVRILKAAVSQVAPGTLQPQRAEWRLLAGGGAVCGRGPPATEKIPTRIIAVKLKTPPHCLSSLLHPRD